MKAFLISARVVVMHTIHDGKHWADGVDVHFHDKLHFCIVVWRVWSIDFLTKYIVSFFSFVVNEWQASPSTVDEYMKYLLIDYSYFHTPYKLVLVFKCYSLTNVKYHQYYQIMLSQYFSKRFRFYKGCCPGSSWNSSTQQCERKYT